MGILYQMGQFTGATTGTLQGMDYTPDFFELTTAVTFLTGAVNALTIALDTTMLGVTASTVPGTLAASAASMAGSGVAEGKLHINDSEKFTQLLAALGTLNKQLGGISATVASGVATNQIIAADQIKKNAFDKEATQAALKRNNLPEVTVTNAGFLDTMRATVTDATAIASQAQVTGFITNTATTAIGTASTYVYDLLPSFGDISNAFTTFTKSLAADTEGTVARGQALTLNTTAQSKVLVA
jgi:hypothetical protein